MKKLLLLLLIANALIAQQASEINPGGILFPRLNTAQRNGLSSPSTGLMIYQTDGLQGFYYNSGTAIIPNWQRLGPAVAGWELTGNSLLATGQLGTLSNNHIDLITNSQTRGRISNLGEFFIGTTSTTIPGDLMGVVANSTFPFAISGYSSFNGAGVFGSVDAGTTQFAGVQGEYKSSASGTYNTAGVRGSNQSISPGTGFRTMSSTGPRAGVIGATSASSGQYTFGVHGSMGSTDIRCGAVIGDDFGLALGALAYFSSNLNDYSVYGFGNAFQTGVPGGRISASEPNTHIGLGIQGGVMGGWIQGQVYGTYLKGDRYSMYIDGKTYVNEPIAELVPNATGSKTPFYGVISETPEVFLRGKSVLKNGIQTVEFSEAFQNLVNMDELVVTVSPLAKSNGLYISDQNFKGFQVKENNEGTSDVSFSWIAIAPRRNLAVHSPEILEANFETKMKGIMVNDSVMEKTVPQYLWWDGTEVRHDKPPTKNINSNYQTVLKKGN